MKLYAEEPEVASRLDDLGLSLPGLLRAVAAGAGGHNATTSFHPSSAAGSYLYFETTAALRRLLVPQGWTADEADGQPRTFNEARGVTIIVQTGDNVTGVIGEHEPTTRHMKGTATRKKVEENGQQIPLFTLNGSPDPSSGQRTWILLVSIVDGQVHAELSLPERMIDSKPGGWRERILLPTQDLGSDIQLGRPESGSDSDFEVAWQL